jgi:hypothetical protein
MAVARNLHTATLLPSQKVLVAGGDDDKSTAEIYDPATGSFSLTAGRRSHARDTPQRCSRMGAYWLRAAGFFSVWHPRSCIHEYARCPLPTGIFASRLTVDACVYLRQSSGGRSGGQDVSLHNLPSVLRFQPAAGSDTVAEGGARRAHSAVMHRCASGTFSGHAPGEQHYGNRPNTATLLAVAT